jgi:hypothetical protein
VTNYPSAKANVKNHPSQGSGELSRQAQRAVPAMSRARVLTLSASAAIACGQVGITRPFGWL